MWGPFSSQIAHLQTSLSSLPLSCSTLYFFSLFLEEWKIKETIWSARRSELSLTWQSHHFHSLANRAKGRNLDWESQVSENEGHLEGINQSGSSSWVEWRLPWQPSWPSSRRTRRRTSWWRTNWQESSSLAPSLTERTWRFSNCPLAEALRLWLFTYGTQWLLLLYSILMETPPIWVRCTNSSSN